MHSLVISSYQCLFVISSYQCLLISSYQCLLVIFPLFFSQRLLAELVVNCDGSLKGEVTQLAAQYQHQTQLGTKAIFHLEAFTAKFMRIYKQFLEEGLADMM